MNSYTFLSWGYGLLDVIWLGKKGINPRDVIERIIPNENCKILDMCCGTLCNGLPIAKANPNCEVYGIDKSKDMLREAKRKIKKNKLDNIKVKIADATDSGLKEKSFDYIIIGLVLHECSKDLRAGILKEAYRLLKDEGKLIILEWEEKSDILSRIKYAPLYVSEALNCKDFKEFYHCNKTDYFNQNGFEMQSETHCNYSCVMVLKKRFSPNRRLPGNPNRCTKVKQTENQEREIH